MVAAPGFGEHFVASDGTAIESRLSEVAGDQWQRLFFAQVVPLAAAAQGLDLLHASAVELGGRAVAFTGAPGIGKTSLAAQLVARGHGFVTDDVLAVETDGAALVAYPGPAVLHVDPCELDPHVGDRFHALGPSADEPRKLRVRTTPVAGSLPLAARRLRPPGRPGARAEAGARGARRQSSPRRGLSRLHGRRPTSVGSPGRLRSASRRRRAVRVGSAARPQRGRDCRLSPRPPTASAPVVTTELTRPHRLPPRAKAWLGLEIARTYLQVRAALRQRDLRAVVSQLRAADTPAPRHPELAAARLAAVVQRTLASAPPRSRCLVQSLVLTRLLARRGIESSLVIAVSPGQRFAAHAWVESGGIELLPSGGLALQNARPPLTAPGSDLFRPDERWLQPVKSESG